MEVALNLEELKQIALAEQEAVVPLEHTVRVWLPVAFLRSGEAKTALESEVKANGLEHKCKVKGVGCMGLCAAGPLVEQSRQRQSHNVSVGRAGRRGAIVERLLGKDRSSAWCCPLTSRSSQDKRRLCWRTPG